MEFGRSSFRLGPATVDLDAATARLGTAQSSLTPLEVKLLRYLAAQAGRVVPRTELLVEVWGYRPHLRTRTVDNTVCRLRDKIESDPANPEHLLAVYGQGLRLVGVTAEGDPVGRRGGPFVGRAEELAHATAALRAGTGPVTICGPPGAGKSRLAREIAHGWTDPAVVVELGSARSGDDVDTAVAGALGVAGAGDPRSVVLETLATRGPLLLVLDTCEHAADAVAGRLPAWRARSPGLAVLATSRRPLRDPAEQRILLGALPPRDAADLFVARARLGVPAFVADAADLSRLVGALDGLPLAIELAAARAPVLSVRELIALVERQLEVLGGTAHGLRAAVDGALELLAPGDRRLLLDLAAFEGPFSLADARAVSERGAGALDGVQLLVEHGLLRVVAASDSGAPETRYTPYAFVRERLLEDLDPANPVLARHAARFAALGAREHLEAAATRAELRTTLRLASVELQAALRRTSDPASPAYDRDVALDCGLALVWRLAREGPIAPALALVPKLLELPRTDAQRVRLGAQQVLLRKFASEYQRGLDETDAVAELDGNPADVVALRTTRSVFYQQTGRHEEGERELEAAAPYVPLSRAARGPYLQHLANVQGSVEAGERMLLEAARVSAEWGDTINEAGSYSILGHVFMSHGNWSKSAIYFDRALALFGADAPSARGRSVCLTFAGMLASRQGDVERAEGLLAEAAQLQRLVGNTETLELTRVEQATLAVACGRADQAISALKAILADIVVHPSWNATIAYLSLAEAEFLTGRYGRARQSAENALEHAVPGRFHVAAAGAHDVLALVDAHEGRTEAAREHLRTSDALGTYPSSRVRHNAIEAIVAALAGEPDAARRLEPAYALASTLEMEDGSIELQWVRLAEDVLERPGGADERRVRLV